MQRTIIAEGAIAPLFKQLKQAVAERDRLLALLALQLATFAPVWRWYFLRMTDPSDEPWGLVALVTAIYLCVQEAGTKLNRRSNIHRETIPAWTFVFSFLYIASYQCTPPLVHAAFAVLAIGSFVSRNVFDRAWHPGLWGLLFLSLPLVPTLQFYLGYPLRALTAWIAAHLLALGGMAVASSGTVLQFQDQFVWLDAPCSGVKMMWTASYLACTLSLLFRLSAREAFQLSICTPFVVLAANVVRACFLFLLETKLAGYPPLLHSAVGLLSFASAGLEIVFLASFMKSRTHREANRKTAFTSHRRRLAFFLLQFACLCCPLLPGHADAAPEGFNPKWPTEFQGGQLTELPLSARELAFQEEFPGKIKRFAAGKKELIVRIVATPTRKLHPAEHCLKGLGYSVEPQPAKVLEGQTWSCSLAKRGGGVMRICERIEDSRGRSFPDVSTWYWAATFGSSVGPWTSYTASEAQS